MAYGYGGYGYGGFAPYVSVAERRRRAEKELAKLAQKGHPVAPVVLEGKKIATSFWGKAWCDNLEGYADFASRLGRGRSYVRNGSVVDLQVKAGQVDARVAGSELYRTRVTVKAVPAPRWADLRRDCAGGIDSLIELLQGRLTRAVMERICRREGGLFPAPAEISFDCSCPDMASMCKHVAAVLYGVGARLDRAPELLFTLRAVDHGELIAGVAREVPLARKGPTRSRVLEDDDDLSALFGIDIAGEPAAVAVGTTPKARAATAALMKAPTVKAVKAAVKATPVKATTAARVKTTMELPPTKATPVKAVNAVKTVKVKGVTVKGVTVKPTPVKATQPATAKRTIEPPPTKATAAARAKAIEPPPTKTTAKTTVRARRPR
jgi:uncharacterized Zn finger protein